MATISRSFHRTVIEMPAKRAPRRQPALPTRVDEESKPTIRDNQDLIQGCLDGDESAWKELVERYGRLVYSIPRRYGLSAADADDVFQNVFAIVLRSLHGLRNQTCLSAWLITITHRETRRLAKSAPLNAELDDTIPDDASPASDHVQRLELQQAVREALAEMNDCCKELLSSLLLDDAPSYQQLAERLGMAVGSIGPTRARCFKKLEAILRERGIEAP